MSEPYLKTDLPWIVLNPLREQGSAQAEALAAKLKELRQTKPPDLALKEDSLRWMKDNDITRLAEKLGGRNEALPETERRRWILRLSSQTVLAGQTEKALSFVRVLFKRDPFIGEDAAELISALAVENGQGETVWRELEQQTWTPTQQIAAYRGFIAAIEPPPPADKEMKPKQSQNQKKPPKPIPRKPGDGEKHHSKTEQSESFIYRKRSLSVTRILITALLLGGFSGIGPQPLLAQGNASLEPKVHMMQTGANRLLQDLDAVMSLTNAKEQQQNQEIKKYLDVFLVGVDKTRLVRMDWIFGEGPVRYRPAIPVNPQDEQIFWKQNLIPNGINKDRRLAKSLYSTKGVFKGYMRFRDKYAIFAEQIEDLPFNAPPPEQAVAHLLKYTNNAAVELVNVAQGVEQRHASFNGGDGLRKQLTKDLKKTKSETDDAFDLRKLAFGQQLDELERIYAEAMYSRLVANFDQNKKIGTLGFELTPIPKHRPREKRANSRAGALKLCQRAQSRQIQHEL